MADTLALEANSFESVGSSPTPGITKERFL